MSPAVFHERVDHRRVVSGMFRSKEEPVFRSELEWSHGVLGEVVINLKTPVLKSTLPDLPSDRGRRRELFP